MEEQGANGLVSCSLIEKIAILKGMNLEATGS